MPFLVGFAPLFSRSDDRKFMLPAKVIAQAADVVIALFAVMVFLMIDVIGGAENNVVVNVAFIYMGADNI